MIARLSFALIVAGGTGALAGGCFTTFPTSCGDALLQGREECDDGNRFGGDGCSANCQLEFPFAVCGDGFVDPPENCDPPNVGGCGPDCRWSNAVCGNLVVEPGEQCDPPDGEACSPFCQIGGPPQPPGSPCELDQDCGAPANPAHTALCLNSPDFPNGMCVLLGCSDFGAGSDCPTGSDCVTVPAGGGGVVDLCTPTCEPDGGGTSGCREDEDAEGAYACYPTLTGNGGICWAGCATATDCNDTTLPVEQWTSACSDGNNRCYVAGTPGAMVGDPCTVDEECTEAGTCLVGDWTGDGSVDWPGGYCSKIGCAAYASNPLWACPAGATCAALATPWQAVLPIDICLADCVGDGSSGTCLRPDDYECMDFADLTGAMSDGVAPAGAGGWCFECPFEHEVAGGDPASCP